MISLTILARHEAGHLLMLWLLEREPGGVTITEGIGGLTIDDTPFPEYQHQRLLRMLAGIVFEGDYQTLDELVENCHTPEVFDPLSDSYWISKTVLELAAQWKMPPDDILAGFTSTLDELRLEFNEAANEIAQVLLDRKTISKPDCEIIYRQLDVRFGMADRPPKSDIVCRLIAKHFGWGVPDRQTLGWDFKPLPEGYVAPERAELRELMEKVKEQIQGFKAEPAG